MTITKTCLEGKGGVASVGQRACVGNLVPYEWYKHAISYPGSSHFSAITTLSKFVYFYRPGALRKLVLAVSELSRHYQYFLQYSHCKFNLTYSQVKEALD